MELCDPKVLLIKVGFFGLFEKKNTLEIILWIDPGVLCCFHSHGLVDLKKLA
ncbi:hypothetical protein ABIE13_003146 [Ottowia thiooxydans]|uniref:Transposase n=1 Tax=Ottowia thiooxydans TaxID=219182 RepID=A0ABV2QAI6_9BURK